MNVSNRSWRTTLCAIVALVGAAMVALNAILDDKPETKPDVPALVEQTNRTLEYFGLSLFGLGTALTGIFARDNKVTSAQLGIEKGQT